MAVQHVTLSNLPEILGNGGKLPSGFLSSSGGVARTVYASAIPGVVLDCVMATGLTGSGSTPTDNASRINAVLATASASSPVKLILDGGCAIGAPLLIPATGYVTIEGLGWGTGLYVLPGSNAQAVQNVPHTDLSIWTGWNPSGAQSIVGHEVALRHLKIVGNKSGTGSAGNTLSSASNSTGNAGRDGTVTNSTALASTGDARGPYSAGYWLSGVMLVGIDNVVLDDVWIYDAPAYSVSLYHCTNVHASDSRFEAADPTKPGNTDGIHFNGGCRNLWVHDCYFRTGDDPVGGNFDEGDRYPGGNLSWHDCYLDNCLTGGRIYGSQIASSAVKISGIRGVVQYHGLLLGDDNTTTSGADLNQSVSLDDIDVKVTTSGGVGIFLCGNAGSVSLTNIKVTGPTQSGPVVQVGSASGVAPTISSLKIDAATYRDGSGNAAQPALTVLAGSVTTLDLSYRCRDLAGSSYTPIADLISISGGTIGTLRQGDVDMLHVSALTNSPSSIGSIFSPSYRPVDAQTGTSYTLGISDLGQMVTLSNASAITLTIPAYASVPFPIGSEIDLAQLGAGQVTVSPASGVTLESLGGKVNLAGQYAGATLKKLATDTWIMIGGLA